MSDVVKLTKLVNGELLIGCVVEDGDNLIINKPFQVGVIKDQIALIDFNAQLGNDEVLTVKVSNVLYSFTANDITSNAYLQKCSDIIIPDNNTQNVSVENLIT